MRKPVALDALHDRNTLYRNLESGEIENVYTLKIMNKDDRSHRFVVTLEALAGKPRDMGRDTGGEAASDAGRYRLDPAQPVFDVGPGEVYNAAVRVRANAWDDEHDKSDEEDEDEATASVRFRIQAADDPNIAAAAIARFFSPED